MRFNQQTYKLTESGRLGPVALVAGVIGLVLSAVGYLVDARQFFYSYLTGYFFWLSLALGGLFFTMLHHIVGARWSTVLRRISENIMGVLPVLALLAIPLLFGIGELYHWSHSDAVAEDQLLQDKAGYLNTTFFVIRLVVYFTVWIVLTVMLDKISLKQDLGHQPSFTKKMRVISAPGIILFALTVTFASFDWLMSLDPHWYSTIFGVYIFAGSLLGMLALMTVIVLYLGRNGILDKDITVEHYHDLGKLMFAFTIFWGYMAFSQYFLIWYGNIPEETVWFLHRWESSWKTISLMLVFGHFVVPFFVLFPQGTKRNPKTLTLIALWILFMHFIDLYWLVLPTLHPHGVNISWMDITALIGPGGIFTWYLWCKTAARPLLPVGDPNLEVSRRFVNH
ncbi:MAG: hypothetical protein JXA92_09100 [candidate division Zixibacteria bacterium]|nr:hypothetical protein [candidate division Zixibacteria bacterium]